MDVFFTDRVFNTIKMLNILLTVSATLSIDIVANVNITEKPLYITPYIAAEEVLPLPGLLYPRESESREVRQTLTILF